MTPRISMKVMALAALMSAFTFFFVHQASARPIRYTAFVISDVRIGQQQFKHARVYLSFDSDTSFVQPFTDATSSGFVNKIGFAHVKVISGNQVIFADLAPHQVFVYFDVAHASVGFGSFAGGRGYPLSLTANDGDPNGLVNNSLVGAVADIINNGNAAAYSPATAGLVSDLTKPTTLSGGASSCVAFDVTNSTCSNLTPIPLKTTAGPFSLIEAFTDTDPFVGPNPYTITWGMFWARYLR